MARGAGEATGRLSQPMAQCGKPAGGTRTGLAIASGRVGVVPHFASTGAMPTGVAEAVALRGGGRRPGSRGEVMNSQGDWAACGLRCCRLAAAIGMALSLAACGGGGGGGTVKPTAPAPASTAPPPPPQDAQLSITNTYAAQKQGYTGAGVTIGVVDSGIMRSNPAVAGRVTQELVYVDPTANNTNIDDVVGHGTWVSEIAAGTAFGKFPGGIAPGASLVSARIISDTEPKDDGSGNGNPVTA